VQTNTPRKTGEPKSKEEQSSKIVTTSKHPDTWRPKPLQAYKPAEDLGQAVARDPNHTGASESLDFHLCLSGQGSLSPETHEDSVKICVPPPPGVAGAQSPPLGLDESRGEEGGS
jgi:hypothetical protein